MRQPPCLNKSNYSVQGVIAMLGGLLLFIVLGLMFSFVGILFAIVGALLIPIFLYAICFKLLTGRMPSFVTFRYTVTNTKTGDNNT